MVIHPEEKVMQYRTLVRVFCWLYPGGISGLEDPCVFFIYLFFNVTNVGTELKYAAISAVTHAYF